MGAPIPDDPAQPPGARNLVRILTETLEVHDEALSAGDNLKARLTPQHYTGAARDALVDTGLAKLQAQWRQVADVHGKAVERVGGHNTFLHNLPDLWAEPADRPRLHELWARHTGMVADDLLAWAAELDRLGHVDFADPPPPAPRPDPVAPRPEPLPAPPVPPPAPVPVARPDVRQVAAEFAQTYQAADRLRDQMLAGGRADHLRWPG
ncbi:hypothetical protein [Actinokineospora iranica]|uniref:PPE family protein n=1 Tax=Actinokineospora iranica TaxID=1271860 RepID=A0A1G6M9P4_9PSEU|nr:hypothetical protein [Actinokineospora iranica]SDC51696.1 hypothetical protein SAMN05216174_102420 [Actinokineospora iranica]